MTGGDAVAGGQAGQHDEQHEHGAQVLRDEAFWDERYRSSSALWSGSPNPQLARESAGLIPGEALDAGSGEGADAIWLAQRGWRVTAVDISAVALARAESRAAEAGEGVAQLITWRHEDLSAWAPPAGRFDLVSAQFLQLPPGPRELIFGRLAAAVAPGGSLLIVAHHPSDLQTTARRPAMPELFYAPADVAAALDPQDWEIAVSEAREREVTDPDGEAIAVHDTVLRARRRGRARITPG